MQNIKISINEFAARIKAKYPQYANMNDLELTRQVTKTFPQYLDVLDAPVPQEPMQPEEPRIPLATRAGEAVLNFIGKEGPKIAGGALGAAVGAPAGPAGVVLGAAAGAAGGEGFRQMNAQLAGAEQADPERIQRAYIEGPLNELGGVVAAKFPAAAGNALLKSPIGAERQLQRVLSPTTKETKFLAGQVAPELVKRNLFEKVALTRAQFAEKAAAAKFNAGQAIEREWANLPKNVRMKTQPIVNAIDKAKQEFVVNNVEVLPAATAKLDELKTIVQTLGPSVSPESLRKTRQVWDMVIDQAGGFGGKDLAATSQVFAQKQAADAIRRQIGLVFPNIERLNAEFSFWSKVDDVLQAAVVRDMNKSISMTDLISGMTGALSAANGGPWWHAGAPLALRFFQSTGWRTASAATKKSLADVAFLLDKGKAQEAVALMGKIATQAGVSLTETENANQR